MDPCLILILYTLVEYAACEWNTYSVCTNIRARCHSMETVLASGQAALSALTCFPGGAPSHPSADLMHLKFTDARLVLPCATSVPAGRFTGLVLSPWWMPAGTGGRRAVWPCSDSYTPRHRYWAVDPQALSTSYSACNGAQPSCASALRLAELGIFPRRPPYLPDKQGPSFCPEANCLLVLGAAVDRRSGALFMVDSTAEGMT